MRRSGVVAAVTGAALLVAVVAVRGGTAADDADLAVGLEEPSPEPSDAAEPVLLSANGVPGLRLGAAPPPSSESFVPETPAGCGMVWLPIEEGTEPRGPADQVTWETSGWVVDGEVVSVLLSSWIDGAAVTAGLDTWLGPTFGSPIEAAQELPGARTATQRPFGALGPEVQVVTVPGRGVEVVLSDLPAFGAVDVAPTGPGRITTLEVRRPGADVCALADVADAVGTGSNGWTVDVDGIGALRLGVSASELVAAEGVTAEGPAYDTGSVYSCQAFTLAADGNSGWARAVAVDGVVTEVQVSDNDLATSFGLPAGADADDVRARFPEVAGRSGPMMGSGIVQVAVDEVTVELQLRPRVGWVPDLERPVEGGVPTLYGVVLRAPDTPVLPC